MKIVIVATVLCSFLWADFIKEDQTVRDTRSRLVWQDNSMVESEELLFSEAKAYCSSLVLAKSADWRLPNVDELQTIIDRQRYDPALQRGFHFGLSKSYWTSTLFSDDTDRAWDIDFKDGKVEHNRHSYDYYVRCVRGGE